MVGLTSGLVLCALLVGLTIEADFGYAKRGYAKTKQN
jgi:hypothetical protein